MSRIETGVVQFDDDWPGVFIRGDNAMFYSQLVRMALKALEPVPSIGLVKANLSGLAETLEACRVSGLGAPEGTQFVKRQSE